MLFPEQLIQKLSPLIAKRKSEEILFKYNSLSNPKARKRFEDKLKLLCYKLLGADFEEKILLIPPEAKELSQENILGNVIYNNIPLFPFGLSNKELLMHTAILGRTGSGKTNVVFKLISELEKNQIPFLIFDWKKNYRSLITKRKDVLIFTPGSEVSPFYFNPLIPPANVPAKVWKEFIVSAIGYSYFIGEGALTLLEQGIDQAYLDFGVYDGICQQYPTFSDVAKIILSKGRRRGREMLWLQSCVRTLYSLINSTIGKCLNIPNNPLPLSSLLKHNVIIELDYLSPSNKVFLTQALLLWIYFDKLSQPRKEELENLIIIEEAQNLLLKGKEEMKSANILPKIIREFRELGIGLCFVAQEASKISTTALQNTFTLIALNQRYRKDIEVLGSSMNLDFKEWDYLGKLPIGCAIVNMKGNFPKSFMVKFPLVKIQKPVTDAQLKRYMQGAFFNKLSLKTPAQENQSNFQLFSDLANISPTQAKTEKSDLKIKQEEIALLLHIYEHPTYSTTQHYKELGLNYRAGNQRKKKLLEQGLIEQEVVFDGSVHKKLLKITPKGIEILQTKGLKVKSPKESPEHLYFKEKLKQKLESNGYQVEEEVKIENGKEKD